LDQLLAGVERRAFRIAELATRNRDEALDVVQDAMFKLVQQYGDRETSEWRPLFYRILQTRIQDWRRRQWVRHRFRVWGMGNQDPDNDPDEQFIENLPDPCPTDPSEHVSHKRAMKALDQHLRNLPFRQRQAFLLRTWEGLNVAQTAQAMGCSEGSVKTHYSRAIHFLRTRLAEHWP